MPDQFAHAFGNRGGQLRRVGLENRVHGFNRRRGLKSPLPAEEFVKHHAEAENIRTRTGLFTANLFRRHVAHRAHDLAGLGAELLGGVVVSRFRTALGETEIEDLGTTLQSHHDVVRFQIAMGDSGDMGRVQAFSDLRRQIERLPQREARAAQGVARDQFADQIHHPTLFADIMQGHDVGMIQRRDGFGFALKSLPAGLIERKLGRQNFERHFTVQTRVTRAEHFAHAASPERSQDQIGAEARSCREGH